MAENLKARARAVREHAAVNEEEEEEISVVFFPYRLVEPHAKVIEPGDLPLGGSVKFGPGNLTKFQGLADPIDVQNVVVRVVVVLFYG